MPSEERLPTVEMSRRELVAGLASGAVVAMTGTALGGCQRNAALGREQLVLVSDADLARLAAGTWESVLAETPRRDDPRVRRVGARVVEAANRRFPDRRLDAYSWEFATFEDDRINAWVMPGGKVGFHTGILDIMENDDQVATVMGHEVGHVVGRHAAERYSQRMVAQGAVALANVALARSDSPYAGEIAAVLGAGVTFGIILPYSRQHEHEADRLGIDFMLGGGYAGREAVRFWEGMSSLSRNRPLEFMSTHPSDENRIANMRGYLTALGAV